MKDRSGTISISRFFEAEFRRRFKWLLREVYKYWIPLQFPITIHYDYPRADEKVTAFLAWLKDMEVKGILTTRQGPGQSRVGSVRWTDTYIEAAYKKGMADAYSYGGYQAVTGLAFDQWIAAGFYLPIHADKVGLLYTRTFNELKGVTDAMDQTISRVLAQGMAEGRNPKAIARDLAVEVRDIGIERSRLIAQTEIMRAHAEGTLNTLESFGVEGVYLQAEWLTAEDDHVCPRCLAKSRNADGSPRIYSIEEAHGLIPDHPRCRCCWTPITEDLPGENRRKARTQKLGENLLEEVA